MVKVQKKDYNNFKSTLDKQVNIYYTRKYRK